MVVSIYRIGTYYILNSEINMFGRKISQEIYIYEHCQRLPLKKWCAFKQARWPGRPTRPCHPARLVPWLTPPGPSSHHLLPFSACQTFASPLRVQESAQPFQTRDRSCSSRIPNSTTHSLTHSLAHHPHIAFPHTNSSWV